MPDILPLPILVDVIPEGISSFIKQHLESKRRNENRPDKSVVPLEEGAVDRTCDRHCLCSQE